MTKLDILYKLEDASNKMTGLLDDSQIDMRKLTKLKKKELLQFLDAVNTMNQVLEKCIIKKKGDKE